MASAAPCMPSSGNGPQPNIRKGSRTAFKIDEVIITNMGAVGFPSARKRLSDIIMKNKKGVPNMITVRYFFERGRIAVVAPKKDKIGS